MLGLGRRANLLIILFLTKQAPAAARRSHVTNIFGQLFSATKVSQVIASVVWAAALMVDIRACLRPHDGPLATHNSEFGTE